MDLIRSTRLKGERSISVGICACCGLPAALLGVGGIVHPAVAAFLVMVPIAGAVGIATLPKDLS